jgi:hypothetical protein
LRQEIFDARVDVETDLVVEFRVEAVARHEVLY